MGPGHCRCNWRSACQCARISPRHVIVFFSPARDNFTNTLHSVKTRLQVQVKTKPGEAPIADSVATEPHYDSTWDAISKIVADDGVKGLYTGMSGSLLGVASTNFAYFYWYSVVRALYFRWAKSAAAPSTAVELSLGAISGAIAQLFTIPVAVVTTRQQTQRKEERKGMIATAREVIDGEDGVSGLWRGLKASLVLVVNPAITYGAYERLKPVLFPGKVLKPWEAFGKSHDNWCNVFDPNANANGSPWCLV